uniref:Uncharacterized protein n=1 Tax=Erpetoichthys calabaricus TaxID=27687 RepID=A0A8C4TME7_ERPCA
MICTYRSERDCRLRFLPSTSVPSCRFQVLISRRQTGKNSHHDEEQIGSKSAKQWSSQGFSNVLFCLLLFRPNLLSLDLSFNDLDCLPALVSSLRTIGQLRCLVLQGNPLALCACYRGFLVDSLPNLTVSVISDCAHITPPPVRITHGLVLKITNPGIVHS